MKKAQALILSIAALMVLAAPTFAQRKSCRSNSPYPSRRVASRYYEDARVNNNNVYNDNANVYYDYGYRNRSFWDRHRDKLTLAIGTGTGAAIGGLLGGKRGAIIGAASGLGGSALYTYKIRNRGYRY